MMKCILQAAVVVLWAGAAAAAAPATAGRPVAIDSGKITGVTTDSGVRVYKGIPYAAAPVGPLRWKPPAPVKAWKGVRACTEFGGICPQPPSPITRKVVGRQTEDCLYLNVWTPARTPAEKLPVMVWIHGGGCTIGAGSMPFYDGRHLAARGVVVVTLNYRLGPLGFLAHPGLSAESPRKVSGNYGLLDQIAALQWVRGNISAFGGDRNRVTIFGESAGGVCCGCLLVSPLAKGLFHRAILQSGTAIGVRTPLRGGARSFEQAGLRLADALGADGPAQMRKRTPEQLLSATRVRVGLFGKGVKYGPNIDGHVLPENPHKMLAEGKINPAEVVIGTNADEGTLFLRQLPIRRPAGYRMLLRLIYRDDAEKVLAAFPPGQDPAAALARLTTAAYFVAPARMAARAISKVQPRTYLYHFTRVSPAMMASGLGATHGIEIPYVFNSAARILRAPADRKLADTMARYWTNFARTGDPNAEGLVNWPAYDAETDRHLELGDRVRPGRNLLKGQCDLFERIAAKKRPR